VNYYFNTIWKMVFGTDIACYISHILNSILCAILLRILCETSINRVTFLCMGLFRKYCKFYSTVQKFGCSKYSARTR